MSSRPGSSLMDANTWVKVQTKPYLYVEAILVCTDLIPWTNGKDPKLNLDIPSLCGKDGGYLFSVVYWLVDF